MKMVDKFRLTGSVSNLKRQPREPTVLTEDTLFSIFSEVIVNPQVSSRRLSRQLGICHSSLYRGMRHHLQLHPYKITRVHQLLPADYLARIHFCEWFSEVVAHDTEFVERCIFTDEAWFHLSGYVNAQNTRYWSTENPHMLHEHPLHSLKLGVWAAMSAKRVFVVFFDTTVTAAIYRGFVDQFVATLTEEEVFHGWFQQDNAPAHTANATLHHLQLYFGDRVISRGLWPPRSPDLSPPDFFLWGFLKDKAYQNMPQTLANLRENILEAISLITPQMLKDVSRSLVFRTEACIHVGGGHFQHL
jgi:hypothetical protein